MNRKHAGLAVDDDLDGQQSHIIFLRCPVVVRFLCKASFSFFTGVFCVSVVCDVCSSDRMKGAAYHGSVWAGFILQVLSFTVSPAPSRNATPTLCAVRVRYCRACRLPYHEHVAHDVRRLLYIRLRFVQ